MKQKKTLQNQNKPSESQLKQNQSQASQFTINEKKEMQHVNIDQCNEQDNLKIIPVIDVKKEQILIGQQSLDLLGNLFCKEHQTKISYICNEKNNKFHKVLFCSNCILQEESFVKNHKNSMVRIDQYIPQQINEVCGIKEERQFDEMIAKNKELRNYMNHNLMESIKKVQQDFNQLKTTFVNYCDQIVQDVQQRLNNFMKQIDNKMEYQEQLAQKYYNVHQKQQKSMYKQMSDFLKEFDQNTDSRLNYFLNRFQNIIIEYSSSDFLDQKLKEYQNLDKYFKNTAFYDQNIFKNLSNTITKDLSSHLQELKFTNLYFEKVEEFQQKELESQQKFQQQFEFKNISIAQKKILCTDHQMSLNQINYVGNDILVTKGNEGSIKFYEQNPNYTFLLLDTLKLVEPCVSVKIDSKTKQLIAAGSNKIYVYDISDVKQVKKFKEIQTGHLKPIRTLDLFENGFITSCQDSKIKVWVDGQLTQELELQHEARVSIINKNKLILGGKSGSITVFKFENNKLELQSIIQAHKQRVTALSFSNVDDLILYSGCRSGSIGIWNIETSICLKKINRVKDCVYNLIPVEQKQNELQGNIPQGAIISMSWDQNISIYDLQNENLLTQSRTQLKFSQKNHYNSEGAQIVQINSNQIDLFTVGNDDKRIEVFQIKLLK